MPESNSLCEQSLQEGRLALSQGDRARAEEAFRSAVCEAEQLGGDSEVLASALSTLGLLSYQTKAYGDAEKSLRRALEIRERMLGDANPGLIESINNLAAVHVAADQLDQAEPLLRRILSISERQLGPSHPEVCGALHNLAQLHLRRHEFSRAEPLLLRLLDLKQALGEHHPEVATVVASLATVRHAQGRYDAAEQLWRRALEIRERSLAPNHFAIAASLEHLAEVCEAQGKLDEAIALLQRALQIRQRTLTVDHPSLAATRAKISDLQLLASQEDSALSLAQSFATTQSNELAESSPELAGVPPPRLALPFTRTAKDPEPRATLDSWREWSLPSEPGPASGPNGNYTPGPGVLSLLDGNPHTVLIPENADEEWLIEEPQPAHGPLATYAVRLAEAVKQKRLQIGVGGAVLAAAAAVLVTVAPPFGSAESTAVRSPSGRVAASEPREPSAAPVQKLSARGAVEGGSTASGANPPVSTKRPSAVGATPSRPNKPQTVALKAPERTRTEKPRPPQESRLNEVVAALENTADASLRSVSRTADAGLESLSRLIGIANAGADPKMQSSGTDFRPPELAEGSPVPQFPGALRSGAVEGEVLAEFVVQADGRVAVETFRELQSDHALLSKAVRDALPRMRFVPGEINGRPASQRLVMPFRFLRAN